MPSTAPKSDRRPLKSLRESAPPPSADTTRLSVPNDINFSKRLKDLIGPRGRRKNPALRKTIRDALQISESTLYHWQHPEVEGGDITNTASKRTKSKPNRNQIVRLAMILADFHKQDRADLVNELLLLGGFPDALNPQGGNDTAHVRSGGSVEDTLNSLYLSGTEILRHTLPNGLPHGTAGTSLGCYLSQHLLVDLSRRWKETKQGGHILFFWRWRNSLLERYFVGNSLEAMKDWLNDLLQEEYKNSTWITVFLLLEGAKFDEEAETSMLDLLNALGTRVNDRMTVYRDSDSLVSIQSEYFDFGLMTNPLITTPFMMVNYDRLYEACVSIDEIEKTSLQEKFNPIRWSTNITLMPDSNVNAYLRERGVKDILPKAPVPVLGTRWKKIKEPADTSLQR